MNLSLNLGRAFSCVWSLAGVLAIQAFLVPSAYSLQETSDKSSSLGSKSTECWEVTFKLAGRETTQVAEVLKQYADGSALLQIADGQLLSLYGEEIISKRSSQQTMQPLTQDQLIESLKPQLNDSFRFYKTKHFVIAYNTSQIYAEWVGQLFERLYRGFLNEWSNRGIKLSEPRFPLVAVAFRTRGDYLEFAQRDIGQDADAMIGYYYINSNRVIMYDITGVDGQVPADEKVAAKMVIQQILAQPNGERNVATIVHEAVHQLAYNCGLQTRLADNPRWLSEGLAMYFEAPDLSSAQGWKIGNVNYFNLRLFLGHLNQRPSNALELLIRDDQRFSDTALAAQAYPESWALTYFLMKSRRKPFTNYMKQIAAMEVLGELQPQQRLALFEEHFGDLQKLDRDFVAYMRKAR